MTLLLAKTTGVQKSRNRLSESDFSISSAPIPLISPQVNPITGLYSDGLLLKLFKLK